MVQLADAGCCSLWLTPSKSRRQWHECEPLGSRQSKSIVVCSNHTQLLRGHALQPPMHSRTLAKHKRSQVQTLGRGPTPRHERTLHNCTHILQHSPDFTLERFIIGRSLNRWCFQWWRQWRRRLLRSCNRRIHAGGHFSTSASRMWTEVIWTTKPGGHARSLTLILLGRSLGFTRTGYLTFFGLTGSRTTRRRTTRPLTARGHLSGSFTRFQRSFSACSETLGYHHWNQSKLQRLLQPSIEPG